MLWELVFYEPTKVLSANQVPAFTANPVLQPRADSCDQSAILRAFFEDDLPSKTLGFLKRAQLFA